MSETTIDTSLSTLEDYFGIDLDLEDFEGKDSDEIFQFLKARLQEMVEAGELDFDDFDLKTDLTDPLDDILDELHLEIQTSIAEFNAIISKGGITVAQQTSYLALIEELDELDELTDSSDGILDFLEEAYDAVQAMYVTVENGDTQVVDLSDADNGDVFVIECETNDSSEGSSHNDENNEGYLDLDGDGYNEYEWDANGDGIPDDLPYLMEEIGDRVGNDGAFTDEDLYDFINGSDTTVVISSDESGKEIESSYIRAYDADTETMEIVLYFTDNTQSLVKVIDADIIVIKPLPTNIESVDPDGLAKIYESESATNSEHYFVYGSEPSSSDASFSYISMESNSNEYSFEATDSLFENGTAVVIDFDNDTSDTFNIDLSEYDDAIISCSIDDDGYPVFTITHDLGAFTITAMGMEISEDLTTVIDTLNFTGGEFDFDGSSFVSLSNTVIPYSDNPDYRYGNALFVMITHNDQTLEEEYEDEHDDGIGHLSFEI